MKTTKATSHAHDTTLNVSNESEIAAMKTTTPSASSTPSPVHSATPTAVHATTADAPATPAAAPKAALPYIKAPPPITLPPVPSGVTTLQPADLRALLPRKQELELMPDVASELARFDDYATVFGKTAPSLAATEQTLSSAYQWSTLRLSLAAWLKYATSQETVAWASSRNVIERLAPAFGLAVKTDASIGESNPSLGSLFGVRASIAKRAAAARAANTSEEAAGRPAYKGVTGKRRKKADEKAALAAQEAAAANAATSSGATPVAAAPVASAPPVTPPAAPVNVTTVGHS